MIAFARIALTWALYVAASRRHSAGAGLPKIVAFQVQPSVPCAKTIGEALDAAGCDVVLRTNVQTKLASICSFEILNSCDDGSAFSEYKGLVATFPVISINRPTPMNATATRPHFIPKADAVHNDTGVLDARHKLGLTGKGIKVAIIDDGVYYLHPALGGGFGPGFKVAFGYDLIGDDYDGTSKSIVPDSDPLDNCSVDAHGTHVAGIVAANATYISLPGFVPRVPFTGVAPGVTLGAYRIFGCNHPSSGSDILASAILRAAEDGADIINVSLGGYSVADEISAIAAQIVRNAGHILVAAMGNSGDAGAYVADTPALSFGALGIASFDIDEPPSLTLYIDGIPYFHSLGARNGSFDFGVPHSSEFVVNNPSAVIDQVLDDGCDKLQVNVTGKTVLFYWGKPNACGSAKRCDLAAAAGAVSCVMYYQSDFVIVDIAGSKSIPSLITTLSAGQAIIADLASNKTPALIVTKGYQKRGGDLSSFSSPGLTNDLFIKPDLGGIGESVYSTISPWAAHSATLASSYNFYSGTSMAAPYVAGCTALLLEKRGKIGFETAQAYLQNTAVVTNIFDISLLVHSPAYQGAGLVNIYWAATTGTLVTPPSLSLNDTAHHKMNQIIRIKNNYQLPVTYSLLHFPAATANTFHTGDDFVLDVFAATFTASNIATVTFPNSTTSYSVTVKPGRSTTVRLDIIAPIPAASDLWPLYGGYIVITNSFDDIVTQVPYAGVAGIWKDRPIWSRNSTSLYKWWGLKSSTGPMGLFETKPISVGTGLYADSTFTPLTRFGVVNATENGLLLFPAASSSRSYNITITYLCKDKAALGAAGLSRTTSTVAIFDVTEACPASYFAPTGILKRNTHTASERMAEPRVYAFDGSAFTDDSFENTVQLPPGVYQMNFVAQKNFGRHNEVDVVRSPPFQLVY